MKERDSIKILQTDSVPNFAESEKKILKYWKERDILQKSIDKNPKENSYTFYDGPITSNNKPHYGHALTMVIKDVVPRYKSMKGFRVDRSLGWDCQGIPVEYEVEKELGFEQKEDIEKFGIEKFNNLCRKSVEKYQGDISLLTERMGRWVNKDEEYATMDATYIESIWWSLKELYSKGLLYQGYKVVPYSTRAGTTLSNSEVALGGYQSIIDPAVVVKLKLKDKESSLLIWTTTPWTLPGNLLAAVGKDFSYTEVEYEGEKYIVGKELVEKIFGKNVKVIKEYKGEELIGLEYESLYPYFEDRREQGAFRVVHADHVTLEEGSGVVHQAPYGEEDFILMSNMGIEMFDYLDDQGNFVDPVEQFKGMFYKKANKYIIEDLKERGLLFSNQEYEHQMPICWRTNTPLIYKPIKSWYVRVSEIKDSLVGENEEINWVPNHVKEGRFGNWLKDARDWALSRDRYWGTPLPIWVCDKCGETEVLGSFAEVKERSGVTLEDPHKPFVDEIEYGCTKCDGTMHRVKEVIDVWYDSGSMPFARFHYPFENKEKFLAKYPAEFIAEGVDQTRGWFYTLHVLGVALFGKKSFRNVIVNGMALASDGTKMSKSKRNYTEVGDILDQYGADSLRLYFLSSPIVYGQEVIFSEKFLKEVSSLFLIPYWNSVKYFLNYKHLHNWEYEKRKYSEDIMDRWIVARLHETIKQVDEGMQNYKLSRAVKPLFSLVDDLSKWYIRRSRERFVNGSTDALDTLYYLLLEISKLLAPFAPFLAESVYATLEADLESVHLEDFPSVDESVLDSKVVEDMKVVREICSIGLNIRDEQKLKVRQPLTKAYVPVKDEILLDIVKGELNVKEAIYANEEVEGSGYVSARVGDVFTTLDTNITEELKEEGLLNEITRGLQVARKEAGCRAGEFVSLKYVVEDNELADMLEKNVKYLEKVGFFSTFERVESIEGGTKVKVDEYSFTVKLE
ncbi:MAG: isoleucine--tRNA ligase [Candidatus Dojkabacteria bacterium]